MAHGLATPSNSRGREGGSTRSANEFVAMSYDDVEGLITTVGVVSALALSFVIGLQVSVTPDSVDLYLLKIGIFYDKNFCDFVVRVISTHTGYNMTQLVGLTDGQDEYFSVADNLCASFHATDEGGWEREGSTPSPSESYWGMRTASDVSYSIAVPFVAAHFPMEHMAGYLVHSGHSNLEIISTSWQGAGIEVGQFYRYCAKSTGSLTFALLGSVLSYMALAASPAREDMQMGNSAPLKTFNRRFTPILVSCYVALMAGVLQFFVVLNASVRILAPFYAKDALARQQMYGLYVLGATLIPLSVYIVHATTQVFAASLRARMMSDSTLAAPTPEGDETTSTGNPMREANVEQEEGTKRDQEERANNKLIVHSLLVSIGVSIVVTYA